jgi:endonuclease/exonuclease/phosphatase (EEP) superfamily protein YafD
MGRWPLPQIRATVRAGGRDVTVYNIHLLPMRRLDYMTEHWREFEDLLGLLSRERGPTVVAGDFNFTETCPQQGALRRTGFRDAHDLAGSGRGATWPVNGILRGVPGIRLDHVYLGPGLTAASARTGVGQGSDHRPIIVDVAWVAHAR